MSEHKFGPEQIPPQSTTESSKKYLRGVRSIATLSSAAQAGAAASYGHLIGDLASDNPEDFRYLAAAVVVGVGSKLLDRWKDYKIKRATADVPQKDPTEVPFSMLTQWTQGLDAQKVKNTTAAISGAMVSVDQPKIAAAAAVVALGGIAKEAYNAHKERKSLLQDITTPPSESDGPGEPQPK
jgi:uncharacterized membrane protein YebE (DUF533 family)